MGFCFYLKHTAMDYFKFSQPKLKNYKYFRTMGGLQENITADFRFAGKKYMVHIIKNPLATYEVEGRVYPYFKEDGKRQIRTSCYAFGALSCDRK